MPYRNVLTYRPTFSPMLWLLLLSVGGMPTGAAIADWPQWRGPKGTGVAPTGTPPLEWDTEKNILWKTRLSGHGHASPVVSGDMIFLSTAIPMGEPFAPKMSGRPGAHDNNAITHRQQFQAWGISAIDGSIKWRTTLAEAVPLEGAHNTASLASASPVTDGEHVYFFFGSQGLHCLTRDGKRVWEKQFGKMHTKHGHGEGASPALSGQTLIVNWDHEGNSFLTALHTATGKERWRITRNEVTSWSTPVITEVDGTQQVIVCGTERVRAYRLSDGKVLWECGGMSANIVATPVVADGIVFVGSSYEKRVLMAIRLAGSSGDITGTNQILWTRYRGTPYVPSPLLYNGSLYFLTHYQNVITRVVAETGEDAPGAVRLGPLSNIYASPVAANGHLFVTDLLGQTLVLTDTAIPRAVSLNPIGESVSASLAIVGSRIFIRGENHLFCVGTE